MCNLKLKYLTRIPADSIRYIRNIADLIIVHQPSGLWICSINSDLGFNLLIHLEVWALHDNIM